MTHTLTTRIEPRKFFTLDWSASITGAIGNVVRQQYPHLIHQWPTVKSHSTEFFRVAAEHFVVLVRDKRDGTPEVNALSLPDIAYHDHPPTDLPPESMALA